MPVPRLTDADIARLLSEEKQLPADFRVRLKLARVGAHYRAQIWLEGGEGSRFRLFIRQLRADPLDFSVGLVELLPEPIGELTLRRYNGNTHEHTNSLERHRFIAFHIHMATERYTACGLAEDKYAEPTGRFSNLSEATECMFSDCGFRVPSESQ